MSLTDKLDVHWYLYIILVLGNCGRLKGLVDKSVAYYQEFTVLPCVLGYDVCSKCCRC